MPMRFTINYQSIPILAIGFTLSSSVIAKAIRLVRGNETNHAFIVTSDRGQLFATEETAGGLVERSLERYRKPSNRIVAMYYWSGWDDATNKNLALDYLAVTRRRALEYSKYDHIGLLSFLPIFKKFIRPDPKRQWCSENVAHVHKLFGYPFAKTEIAPDELYAIVRADKVNFQAVLNYYR